MSIESNIKKIKDEMVIIIYSRDEVANFTKVKEKEQQEKTKQLSCTP